MIAALTLIFSFGFGVLNTQAIGNTQSMDFERSSSEYLEISDSNQSGLDLNSDLTIEAWVKLESLPSSVSPSQYGIVSKYKASGNDRAYRLTIDENDKLQLAISDDGTTSNLHNVVSTNAAFDSSDVGTWVHVAATYDLSSNTGTLYKDGTEISSGGSVSGTVDSIYNNTQPFTIGQANYGSSNTFDGMIDEVRVWSDVRTSTEIDDNRLVNLTGTEANLIGYWNLNDSEDDLTANDNDLSLSGTPEYSEEPAHALTCSFTGLF